MSVQASIERKLRVGLDAVQLEVTNESHMHNVPPGSESHFKVMVVSDGFEGQRLIARHRLVNHLLRDELDGPVHALSIHAYTSAEWFERGGRPPQSPPCLGGGKPAQS
jgi:BolA protein